MGHPLAGGKQLLEDWRVVLGEAALDVQAGSMSTAADSTGMLLLQPAEIKRGHF